MQSSSPQGDAIIGVGSYGPSLNDAGVPFNWDFWGVDSATGGTSCNDRFGPSWDPVGPSTWCTLRATGPGVPYDTCTMWQPCGQGDVLGLLLGSCGTHSSAAHSVCTSLTVYKNGTRVGVARGKPGKNGHDRCWAVKLNSAGSAVRITSKRAPEMPLDDCKAQADAV